MSDNIKYTNWILLLTKLDGLNRRVKEPGWLYEDKREVYRMKDSVMEYILRTRPPELTIELCSVPYYSYSRETKNKAGDLMRADHEKKPFEYYLAQISPGIHDSEISERSTVEIVITCLGQEFCFHQPLNWYTEHGGDGS